MDATSILSMDPMLPALRTSSSTTRDSRVSGSSHSAIILRPTRQTSGISKIWLARSISISSPREAVNSYLLTIRGNTSAWERGYTVCQQHPKTRLQNSGIQVKKESPVQSGIFAQYPYLPGRASKGQPFGFQIAVEITQEIYPEEGT